MSFFEKLEAWKEEYLILKHVFLNFNDYNNLNFNFPIGIILIFLAIALPLAIFFINHRKNTIAICVKQLLRHNAIGESEAKTLKSLRLSDKKSLRRMLTSSGRLATMVRIANYEQPSYEEYIEKQKTKKKIDKIKLDEAKIYLVTDRQKEAESIASIGTTSIWKPTLISIATIVILAVLFILMPEILELINSSIGRN